MRLLVLCDQEFDLEVNLTKGWALSVDLQLQTPREDT